MAKYRIRKLDSKNLVVEKLQGVKTPLWVIKGYFGRASEMVDFLTGLAVTTPPDGVDFDREALAEFSMTIEAAADKIADAIRDCTEFDI